MFLSFESFSRDEIEVFNGFWGFEWWVKMKIQMNIYTFVIKFLWNWSWVTYWFISLFVLGWWTMYIDLVSSFCGRLTWMNIREFVQKLKCIVRSGCFKNALSWALDISMWNLASLISYCLFTSMGCQRSLVGIKRII